jgi:hypothetical protein
MRKLIVLLLCVAPLLAPAGVQAAGNWSVYWGAGGGLVLPKGNGHRTGLNANGRFGLETSLFPGFALEGDVTTSLVKSHFDNRDLRLTTLGGYLAWRSSGQWYFKARAGGMWEWTQVGSGSANDSGLSGGIGGGYRFDDGRALELEFTVIEKNINMLSVTYQF